MPGVTGARKGLVPHPSSSTEGTASVGKERQRAQLPDQGILPRVHTSCLNDNYTTPLKGFTVHLDCQWLILVVALAVGHAILVLLVQA